MRYDEFVNVFVSATDAKKSSVVKKHIVNDYIPYNTKIGEAREIVTRANYMDVDGKRTYMQNSPAAYFLFIIRIIALYTDIEWEDEEVVDMFDSFTKNGIVEAIVVALPKSEYDSFSTVLKMVTDDDYENYRSLAGFLDTKTEAINLLLRALINATEEASSEV